MLFSTNTTIAVDREGIGLDRGIEMLLDAGFPALDLSFFKYRHFVMEDGYKATAKRIRSLVESRGAFFNQAHAPFPINFGDPLDNTNPTYLAVIRAIRSAAILGARCIIVHSVKVPYLSEVPLWDYNLAFYRSLEPVARECGILIGCETLFTRDKKRRRFEGLRRCGHSGSARYLLPLPLFSRGSGYPYLSG